MNRNDVFNAPLKQEFINSRNGITPESAYWAIFKKTALLETPYNKDVCNFTLGEISELLSAFGSGSVGVLESRISILRKYTDFCLSKKQVFDGQNHFDEVTRKMCLGYVDQYKKTKSYISKKDVYAIVDALPNPKDKYLVLAPYEGIYGKDMCEIISLTTDDLLPDNQIRTCTGRVLTVTSKLYNIIEEAGNTYTYMGPDEKVRTLRQTNLIYKPVESKITKLQASAQQITVKLAKLKEYLDDAPVLGVSLLKRSGYCEGMYELSQKYQGLSFESLIKIPEVVEWNERFDISTDALKRNKYHYEEVFNNYINTVINRD